MAEELVRIGYPAIFGINTNPHPATLSPKASGRFIQHTTNLRIDHGRWRTGYAFHELKREDGADGDLWESLNTQAAIWYSPQSGQGSHYVGRGPSRIIDSSGGRMFSIAIEGHRYTVQDISGGNVASGKRLTAWMIQAENYVLRTDGKNQTQIWDGKNPVVFSQGYSVTAKDAARVPNKAGPMVYAGGRVWIVVGDRKIIASNSLHQLDQVGAGDILKFSDQTYDYINTLFAPPADEGDIVAMTVSINSGTGDSRAQGEVIVFCRNDATWAIQLGLPRTQWPSAQMRHTRSKEASALGPNAFAVRDGDILMRTSRGIESMNLLARERAGIGSSMIDLSADVHELVMADSGEDVLFTSMVNPHRWSRMLVTVGTKTQDERFSHAGWLSANWNPANERTPTGFAWEGIGVLPVSFGEVIQFIEARDAGETKVYAITQKPTGKSIVELTQIDGPDLDASGRPTDKQWSLLTKKLTGSDDFSMTGFGEVRIKLDQMTTDVSIEAWVRSDLHPEFMLAREYKASLDGTSTPPRALEGERMAILGRCFDELPQGSSWVQLLIKGQGTCSIDIAMTLPAGARPSEPSDQCEVVDSRSVCEVNPFKLHLYGCKS